MRASGDALRVEPEFAKPRCFLSELGESSAVSVVRFCFFTAELAKKSRRGAKQSMRMFQRDSARRITHCHFGLRHFGFIALCL